MLLLVRPRKLILLEIEMIEMETHMSIMSKGSVIKVPLWRLPQVLQQRCVGVSSWLEEVGVLDIICCRLFEIF